MCVVRIFRCSTNSISIAYRKHASKQHRFIGKRMRAKSVQQQELNASFSMKRFHADDTYFIALHTIRLVCIFCCESNGIPVHSYLLRQNPNTAEKKDSLINCVWNENSRSSHSCLPFLPIWLPTFNSTFSFITVVTHSRTHTHTHTHILRHAYQSCNSIFLDVTSNKWICEWCVFTGFT